MPRISKKESEEKVTSAIEEEIKPTTTPKVEEEKLMDDDEIEIVSLVPNVSYLDSSTSDRYEWEQAGDVETIRFYALKNMFKNQNKNYFLKFWLKPLDDRVIKHFKLERLYDTYAEVTNIDYYEPAKIDDTCKKIQELKEPLSSTVKSIVLNWISKGDITDVKVIKKLSSPDVFNFDIGDILASD